MTTDPFGERFDDLTAVAHRVAYRLLGDRAEAEEVTQEALVRAYLRWRRVAPHAEAWVARVATNLALDVHRRRARHRRHAPRLVGAPHDADHAAGLVARLDLVEGLRRLPRRQREVVALRYLADVSEADTAALLGLSPGTVKQHAHRGLTALRLGLAPPDGGAPAPRHEEDSDVRSSR